MFIKEAKAKIIKNSRKERTIEVAIKTSRGKFFCSAPSGKSKGKNEVPDFNQKGVKHSVKLANIFLSILVEKEIKFNYFEDLQKIEFLLLEFEKNNESLGGNVWYAIEGALLKAAAKERNLEAYQFILNNEKPKIPLPVGNAVGGGLHTRTHKKKPDFQEFLFIAKEKNIAKAVSKNILAYFEAKGKIRWKEKKFFIRTNDENAIITSLPNQEVLEIMRDVARKFDLNIGVDIAASSFFNGENYDYKNKRFLRTREEQLEYIQDLISDFDLFYIEDPFQEEDFLSFKNLLYFVEKTKKNCLIVGDDLTTTNLERVKKAYQLKSINAVIIKPNQIGSLLEVKKVCDFCKKHGIKMIFSHRSGETMDNILADYAVGFGADYIKTGLIGEERLIKLRRLIDIQKEIHKL
ncbi:MAG: enolase C-terminal domain-like protein [Candidatus Pacearchaeota archaeon]